MKISDFTSFLHKNRLPLINSYRDDSGCTIFEFRTEGKNITWLPGQHGLFTLPQKKVTGKKWRAFSVSSIPSENILQIATRISDTPSSLKKFLCQLIPGEEITIRGPYGWMHYLDKASPVIMVAGGVGITPFRSLLKEIESGSERQVHLIYTAHDSYLFKNDLDAITAKNKRVKITYLHTKEECEDMLGKLSRQYLNSAYYFLSGAPHMIKDLKSFLKKKNIISSRVISDSFRGY